MKTNSTPRIDSLASAVAALKGRDAIKLGCETRLERRSGGAVAVRYHSTDVVTYNADGTVTLRTGGWLTVTTKKRMNDYSPFTIYQRAGEWNVVYQGGFTVPYKEGATLAPIYVPERPAEVVA